MYLFRLAAFLLLSAGPMQALEVCDDAWFTRNLIFDRAGYCFGSSLGQAIFDNQDCTTKAPVLTAAQKQTVARVKSVEAEFSCKMNTSQNQLAVPFLDLRRDVEDIPLPTGYESGCFGWRGPALPMRLGKSGSSSQVAQIEPGDNLVWEHEPEGDWSFLTVYRLQELYAVGWVHIDLGTENCDAVAG